MAEDVDEVSVAGGTAADDGPGSRDPVTEGFQLTVAAADRSVDVLWAGSEDVVVESFVGRVHWVWLRVVHTWEITCRIECRTMLMSSI